MPQSNELRISGEGKTYEPDGIFVAVADAHNPETTVAVVHFTARPGVDYCSNNLDPAVNFAAYRAGGNSDEPYTATIGGSVPLRAMTKDNFILAAANVGQPPAPDELAALQSVLNNL